MSGWKDSNVSLRLGSVSTRRSSNLTSWFSRSPAPIYSRARVEWLTWHQKPKIPQDVLVYSRHFVHLNQEFIEESRDFIEDCQDVLVYNRHFAHLNQEFIEESRDVLEYNRHVIHLNQDFIEESRDVLVDNGHFIFLIDYENVVSG
jgi:hypothetical protein